MAAPILDEEKSKAPSVSETPVRRRSLWARIRGSRFLLVSILVHVLFGIGAAIYVVQVYTPTRKLTFKGGPPSPNRSERSIEHKVQMAKKQSTMSAPAMKRIVSTGLAKVTLPEMPAMPQSNAAPTKMAGVGGAGFGMPSSMSGGQASSAGGGPISFFGLREGGGGAFAGTFFDLKQTQTHRSTEMTEAKYNDAITNFLRSGWKDSVFKDFYKAPNTLYNTQVFTPYMHADEGPKAFKVSGEVKPNLWVVVYRGSVSPPESGTYHFVGAGDDLMIVRFNGGVVLDGSWNSHSSFNPAGSYDYGFSEIPRKFVKGSAISAQAGTYYPMEILIGEEPGGEFFADLLIEKDGEKYDKESHGSPVLPIFRVADGKMPALKSKQTIPPFKKDGPIWRAQSLKPPAP